MSRILRSFRTPVTVMVAAVVTVAAVAAILASAHFTKNTGHLGKHAWKQFIKAKVFTKVQLNTGDGDAPNTGSNRVHWQNLNGVPAGFADGIDDGGPPAWELTGNAGTTGANFLGTTDDQALELKVNGERALRLEPHATSPNLVGGNAGNEVTAGAVGAVIGGGGSLGLENTVTDEFSTVGGGRDNRAGNDDGPTGNATHATVGGGLSNIAGTTFATVGGGSLNSAGGPQATVGGGVSNNAGGEVATVGGGQSNTASAERATVGGGRDNQVIAAFGTISGGAPSDLGNIANTRNMVTDEYGTVGGGGNNRAGDSDVTLDDATFATVGGGLGNRASGDRATVGGGLTNTAGSHATVGGGTFNMASGFEATVGGGATNTASGLRATVPGGRLNVAAGDFSLAAGRHAEVLAAHDGSFVWADSCNNGAGGTTECPTGAEAVNFASTTDDEFSVRSTGGARFVSAVSAAGAPTAGVSLAPGGTSWGVISDEALKENVVPVDGSHVLDALTEVPISTWNAKSQDPSIRHIGPMAQDFHSAFGVGEDDRHITTIDADGVALAAIQGLHQELDEKESRIVALEERLASDTGTAPSAPGGWGWAMVLGLGLAGGVAGGIMGGARIAARRLAVS